MLNRTLLRCGVLGLALVAGVAEAAAQGAGGGSGGTASGGTASGGTTGLTSGPVQGEGGQADRQNKGADGSTSKGVAGTGLGATTPAMRADTSSTGGNGMSVQRPDPGTAKAGGSGSAPSP